LTADGLTLLLVFHLFLRIERLPLFAGGEPSAQSEHTSHQHDLLHLYLLTLDVRRNGAGSTWRCTPRRARSARTELWPGDAPRCVCPPRALGCRPGRSPVASFCVERLRWLPCAS